MKKIIVPTDFTKEAARAYPVAAEIARRFKAELILLHIVPSHIRVISNLPTSSPVVIKDADNESVKAEVKKASALMEKELKLPIFKGLNVTSDIPDVKDTKPIKQVLDYLNKGEHSLLIMGTAGSEQVGESNAEIIARHASIPIITVKKDRKSYTIRRIVLATDFKTINFKFVNRVKKLQEQFVAKLDILYINTPKHFKDSVYIEREWDRLCKKYELQHTNLVVYSAHSVEDGIMNYANKEEADMLAIPTHGRTGFSHFIYGSYTEDIINAMNIPVLTYNMSNALHDSNVGYSNTSYTRGFSG